MKKITALTLATALAGAAVPALAQEQGDMTLGFGIGYVSPEDIYSNTLAGGLRADVRWINIETDATVGGAPIGKVSIDPWVFGVSYAMKF